MPKNRLEAFSDGVLAIIITIMVLELKPPHDAELDVLRKLWPIVLSYVLSFIYIGIYWNNHHHLMHATHHVTGGVLWANLHLLFWLSLIPFVTGWMGENHFAKIPVAAYGIVLLCSALAYRLLVIVLLRSHDSTSMLARSLGSDLKGKISVLIYVLGIALTFVLPVIGLACYAGVAIIWLIPDRRIEKRIAHEPQSH